MAPSEMVEFVKDIKAVGLLAPIILLDGQILDGRHRYEACQLAGIEPRFEQFSGPDPLEYVLSSNLARRHLTVGQKAVLADKIANLKPGDNQHSVQKHSKTPTIPQKEVVGIPTTSQKAAADRVGVSRDAVSTAHKVATASPALAKQVEAGTISLNKAEKILDAAKLKPDQSKVFDETEFAVPARLLQFWERSHEGREMMQTISNWRRALKKAKEGNDPLWRHVSHGTMEEGFATLFSQFRALIPYAVCPACHGLERPNCQQCKGVGFLSEYLWSMTVPEEAKKMRELLAKTRKAKK